MVVGPDRGSKYVDNHSTDELELNKAAKGDKQNSSPMDSISMPTGHGIALTPYKGACKCRFLKKSVTRHRVAVN